MPSYVIMEIDDETQSVHYTIKYLKQVIIVFEIIYKKVVDISYSL